MRNLIIILFSCVLLSECHKDESNPTLPKCYLTSLSVKSPTGNDTINFTYSSNNLLIHLWDVNGRFSTTFRYDNNGNLISLKAPSKNFKFVYTNSSGPIAANDSLSS